MESLVEKGLVRYIGVSNFRASDLREILSFCTIRPFCNQVEFNPYLQQPLLREFCQNENILMAAYSPLASLTLFPSGPIDDVIKQLSEKYNVSEGSILLRYTQQKGLIAITTSSKPQRLQQIISNYLNIPYNTCQFSLNEEDMTIIDQEGQKWFRRKYWSDCFEPDVDSGLI
jgi:diketogulonate reductase-like aldo/keto reductase